MKAIEEMKLANIPESIQTVILAMLAEVDKEGHSGGSMGVFSATVRYWAENPDIELGQDDLRAPLSTILQQHKEVIGREGYSKSDVIRLMERVMTHQPLTLLTGADDEWIDVGDGVWQNKRCYHIFKYSIDGPAYNIEGRIFYEPTDGGYWGGYTCRDSRTVVEFPYDATTPPIEVYYADLSHKQILPPEIDPKAYIKLLYNKVVMGLNPFTSAVDEKRLFIPLDSQDIIASRVAYIDDLARTLLFGEHGRHNRVVLINYMRDYQEYASTQDEAEYYLKKLKGRSVDELSGIDFGILARLAFELEDDSIIDDVGDYVIGDRTHKLKACQVMRPSKNYQSWEDDRFVVINWVANNDTDYNVYYDKPYIVYGDENSYLYNKRRELGLAHPKRKQRGESDTIVHLNESPAISPESDVE